MPHEFKTAVLRMNVPDSNGVVFPQAEVELMLQRLNGSPVEVHRNFKPVGIAKDFTLREDGYLMATIVLHEDYCVSVSVDRTIKGYDGIRTVEGTMRLENIIATSQGLAFEPPKA